MAAPPRKALYVAPFHRLEAALGPALRALEAGDPLRPRRVVVTSNLLRDHLQERLSHEGAFAGVEFLTLRDLAQALAGDALRREGSRPLSPLGAEALAGRVLAEELPRLAHLRPEGGPGMVAAYGEALAATLTDLAEGLVAPEDLERFAASGRFPAADRERLADLARLARAYATAIREKNFYDDAMLLRAACEEAEARPPGVPTVLYGFADMNALQQRLAAACCRDAPGAAFVPADPEAPACRWAAPLMNWFRGLGFVDAPAPAAPPRPLEAASRRLFGDGPPAAPPGSAIAAVSAPTPSREAFELCRELLYAPDRRGEAAVLCPAQEPYAPLFRETLSGLGVPARVEEPPRAAGCPAGRAFLSMLSLREEGYPREDLLRFLGATGGADAARWEYLSRDLPFVSGEEGWRVALARARERLARREDTETEALTSFEATLGNLFTRLAAFPPRALPSVHARAVLGAFDALTETHEGREAVEAALDRLGVLDDVLGEVDQATFRRWARAALDAEPVREEKGRAAVRVLTLQAARGLSFEAVALPGMSEGSFPARGVEDPLLPDALRRAINRSAGAGSFLPLKGDRAAEARYQFWLALLAAEKRIVLGVPRADGGGRGDGERPPSLFLARLAEVCGGDRLPGLREVPASLDEASLAGRPVSPAEGDLADILKQLRLREPGALAWLGSPPGFTRRRRALDDRWRRGALTEQDGLFVSGDFAAAFRETLGERPAVSVTALETFFTCPYRFAWRHLLDLRAREAAQPPFEADRAMRGSLFHRILKGFFERVRKTGVPLAEIGEKRWSGWLREEADAIFRDAEERGEALLPLPWRRLREEAEGELGEFLRGYPEGWISAAAEGDFAASVSLPEGALGLTGRFDLMERREKEIRFVDFKTGRSVPTRKDVLDGGRNLQAHLYPRFAMLDEEDMRAGGAYAFVTRVGGYAWRPIPPAAVGAKVAAVDALLGFFLRAAGERVFFCAPSRACDFCDYLPICGPDVKERGGRKEDAPLRATLTALQTATADDKKKQKEEKNIAKPKRGRKKK